MGRLLRILLVAFVVLLARPARAQYYTWGSDAPQKWSTIRTSDVRMIYPDTVADLARRTLFYVRSVQPDIGYGFRHGPMRIPFVMHPENFESNGLVMYLPKRVEFLTSPAIDSYSMPWYKQLVAHEYRHAVQYNNLDRGVIRVLSYALGQQGSTIGLLCMPVWAMEGDATLSETMYSSFGRGLQPSFSMGYRAMEGVGFNAAGRRRKNSDKWFCGSYRDYIPDHYELGYQICSYAWERYGENIWDKVAWFGSRNPYLLATTRIALGKYYRTDVNGLFRATFDSLQTFWDSLPVPEESTEPLRQLPARNYTTYQWPLSLPDGGVVALKSDYAEPSRLVRIDPATGEERMLARTGSFSTRPVLDGKGRLWWTEYRRSQLFEQRVNSRLCYLDPGESHPRTVRRVRRALYPTPFEGGLAWVVYQPDGRYSVEVHHDNDSRVERYAVPVDCELHGLAWDDVTRAFYALVTNDGGMHIARIDAERLHPITAAAYITLSDLRAAGGRLYFGSIASGRDEAHCYDLLARREYRLTTSRYGSFDPAPADGGKVLVTSYSRRGYAPAVQRFDTLLPVTPSRLPQNVVNPPRRRWEVVNLDTIRFTTAADSAQRRELRSKRYLKAPNLLNIHSWTPVAFNPFDAVDEHVVDLNLGFTLLSQNLLSNTEAYASYGWNRAEGSLVNLGVRYFGLGVVFDLDFSYGGNQLFYRLKSYDEKTHLPIYQTAPSPDRYYSVGLSATLPLLFQRGYHTRQLSVMTGWNYSNGMIADLKRIEWADGKISNLQRIGFKEGLHKLSVGVGYSDMVALAHRDFAPRLGYALNAIYTVNPSNDNFCDLVSFFGRLYLPGVAAHHSVNLAATYQTSLGGYKFPSGYAPLSYRSSALVPRGFSSADIMSNDYSAFEANYQLPLCYPEGGIPSVLYVKRIRLNVGGDFARFRDIAGQGMAWRHLWSVGGDLIFDINAFRQPASATSQVKFSYYRPSSGEGWFSVSLGLPF